MVSSPPLYGLNFELMGGDGGRTIIDEEAKRKINPTLPPLVPGPKTLADLP
jgi:hypothetical protein